MLSVSSDIISDIRNAINSEKTAIISESNIQFFSWQGVGYVLTDPITGSGSYLISGKLAGSHSGDRVTVDEESLRGYLYKTVSNKVMAAAKLCVGSPYKWSKEEPVEGFDCSGLVRYCYSVAGINVSSKKPGNGVSKIYYACEDNNWLYSISDRTQADIWFYNDKEHTGIYAGVDTLRWRIYDAVGIKMRNLYPTDVTISPDSTYFTYIGEACIQASGSQDGTQGFGKVVEVPYKYIDQKLGDKVGGPSIITIRK